MLSFKQFLKEAWTFGPDGSRVGNWDDSNIFKRCTNMTLKAFGICSTVKMFNNYTVTSELVKAGFNVIELDSIKGVAEYDMTIGKLYQTSQIQKKFYGKTLSWNKLKPIVDSYRPGMTIAAFLSQTNLHKFDWVLTVRDHSLGFVGGVLYDYEDRGASKKRLTQAFLILSDSKMKRLID